MIEGIKGSSVFGCHNSLFWKGYQMKLSIRNVAQVQSADICIDGLTVIAGRNNTGKSTIGKTLFAMFNSVYNIQEKVHDKINRDIYSVCSQAIRNYMAHSSVKLDSGRNYHRLSILMLYQKMVIRWQRRQRRKTVRLVLRTAL